MDKVKLNGRDKFKGRWDGTNFSFERDRSYGFSWPQRNYNCNFCKKEFKSAQALGGHMNVHRRDRAKQLTQHSSSSSSSEINASHLHPNPNPKPNPNHDKLLPPPQQPTSARFFPYMATTPNFNYPDDALTVSPQIREIRQKLAVEAKCQYEFKSRKKKDDVKSCDEAARVHTKKSTADHQYMELDSNMITAIALDGKEDLDLELRLGSF